MVDVIAQQTVTALRKAYPNFGFGAKKDLLKDDMRMEWFQAKVKGTIPATEFPFKELNNDEPQGEGDGEGRPSLLNFLQNNSGMTRQEMHEAAKARAAGGQQVGGRRGAVARKPQAGEATELFTQQEKEAFVKLKMSEMSKELKRQYATDPELREVAEDLGVLVKNGMFIWEIEPKFHDPAKQNPEQPYVTGFDMLGGEAASLLTGPAFHPDVLADDQKTFEVHTDETVLHPDTKTPLNYAHVKKALFYKLLVTTEGDLQVTRVNGLEYSKAVRPPAGGKVGDILYNRGNERHAFLKNQEREFLKIQQNGVWVNAKTGDKVVPGHHGTGNYEPAELQVVEDHDRKLMNDTERRIAARTVLPSFWATFTARGGYGSERRPLPKRTLPDGTSALNKVLIIDAKGPQFEKYGRGSFTYYTEPKHTDLNALEVSDFIIVPGAESNSSPLFPDLYPNGRIPSHAEVETNQADIASAIGKDFDRNYVKLKDGAYFNRQAYLDRSTKYTNFVLRTINDRLWGKPYYLKATLYGGGFFADANEAGNLRPEVVYGMILSYTQNIDRGLIPPGSIIEFPSYGKYEDLPQHLRRDLESSARKHQIKLVWTPKGDLFDIDMKTAMGNEKIDPTSFLDNRAFVVLNAGDAMAQFGNEPKSLSVEAMMGNVISRAIANVYLNPFGIQSIRESYTGNSSTDEIALSHNAMGLARWQRLLSRKIKAISKENNVLKELIQLSLDISAHKALGISLHQNLHLVFPTLFQTRSPTAELSEHFFSNDNVNAILQDWALRRHYSMYAGYALCTFLGVTLGDTITLDKNIVGPFLNEDPSGRSYAQAISRAMQFALLFEIEGTPEGTMKMVQKIVAEIRAQHLSLNLGYGDGVDLILNSPEMQKIAQLKKLA
jgi:hypothetical protein